MNAHRISSLTGLVGSIHNQETVFMSLYTTMCMQITLITDDNLFIEDSIRVQTLQIL